MGQNISCLTQIIEGISEASQLVSMPSPSLRRRSVSDVSEGSVSGVPKEDWDSAHEEGFCLFLITYYKIMHSGKPLSVLTVVTESASVRGICNSYM